MSADIREAFEAWATRQGVSLKRVSERENATYTNYETYLAYHAWQDATAIHAARVRQLEEALRQCTDSRLTRESIDHIARSAIATGEPS